MQNTLADSVVKILLLSTIIAIFISAQKYLVSKNYHAPDKLPNHMTVEEKRQFKQKLTGG